MSGRGERWEPLRGRTYASQRAAVALGSQRQRELPLFCSPARRASGSPSGKTVAMADYEDHDLLVARHASSRKDRHRRRKYRRDRVRPEDRDDLVAGLRQSHDAWTDVVKDRHADDDFYHDDERRSRSASASPVKRPPQRRDDDDVMVQVQRELATQLHRQEQLHASMEKLLDRQRRLAQELVERDEASRRHVQRIEAVVSSMATGEAVPDAPAAGPSSAGAWDGVGAHANTMPRLAEELPYTEGLLKWTEENVGELFACIAYKHLMVGINEKVDRIINKEVDRIREVDKEEEATMKKDAIRRASEEEARGLEEAGENAREIKQVVMAQGVDGRALLHLTIEDMEKIGEAAGTVEGGGQCALSQVGHRISILNSLVAFRDAHAHEPWETVKNLTLLTRQGQDRDKDESELTAELCKTFGVDIIQGDNSEEALRAAMVHKSSKPKAPKRPEVVVPVFATLLMKKLTEDTDGNLALVGTFIQRPLLYDLKAFDRESGNEALPYFAMRVNEGESKPEDCFEVRKVARDLGPGPKNKDLREGDQKGYFATASTTFVANMPLKLDSVYNEPPFNIMSATCMIELTSFIGTNALNEKFEMRPSFVSHASDLRNLCSVRYWNRHTIDDMPTWELVTPMPTIEFEYAGFRGKQALYVPKMRITYYLTNDGAIGKYLANVVPILFAYMANAYNIFDSFKGETDFSDYLANNVALGLAITFVIPYLTGAEDRLGSKNSFLVIWMFVSFAVSIPAYLVRWQEPLFRLGNGANVTLAHLAIVFQWASLIIPLYNGLQWQRRLNKIRSNWKQKKDLSMTFLGRPGDISAWEREHKGGKDTKGANKKGQRNVLNEDLRTFVVKTGDPKRPKIKLNPDILSHDAQRTTLQEAGPAHKGRCEPWQFDARNHYIYCGLHRNYYQDPWVARAIDHDEHNEPYKRRLRHGDPPPEE